MLAELPEAAAEGRIAEIYGEIRRLWAVPYVSSLQRHLATRPGRLEWVWSALGPAFRSGQAQTAAWRVAGGLELPTLSPLPAGFLRQFGVDAADQRIIADVCAGFVRVAPVNLMFSGLLRRLLKGERPAGGTTPGSPAATWQPPGALPAPPALADIAALDKDTQAVLLRLGTAVDGQPFVPGLYLMLAHWPAYIAHLGGWLAPLGRAVETDTARKALLAGIDAAVAAQFPTLPPISEQGAPALDEIPAVLAALDMYRRTSPEMVIFGRLIAAALPENN
ncbi:MAG: hypothetical protein O2967_02375 [Proteobacteria bacterium]|nr:hypothetical protein [Pseudomonadota bacterium]